MRSGEIGFVQPFRYSLLLWSILLGIVMFGEWPDAWMLTGSAIVVATGLFTFYREQRLARMRRELTVRPCRARGLCARPALSSVGRRTTLSCSFGSVRAMTTVQAGRSGWPAWSGRQRGCRPSRPQHDGVVLEAVAVPHLDRP